MPETKTLTDDEILQGLKNCDSNITQNYFYKYCRLAYTICDRRYSLHTKPEFDFYSIAHEYYLYLLQKNWQPLEQRRNDISLEHWMMNGFRFTTLDLLKKYERREKVNLTLDENIFETPADDDFVADYREVIEEICLKFYKHDRKAQHILYMKTNGFSGQEIARELGMTPSAVSQRYRKMMDEVVIPYCKDLYSGKISASERLRGRVYFDTDNLSCDMDIAECDHTKIYREYMPEPINLSDRRFTPDNITSLAENEIFVFGSNLLGLHAGGAARVAHTQFGAEWGNGDGIMGQSYAIPTMQGGVETIAPYVDKFIEYAKNHSELTFYVTKIGCGIAGFSEEEIAPLFKNAINLKNVCLPKEFCSVILSEE